MKIKYTELLIFIVSAELVGALSAMITGDFDSFFDRYASPPLMPHSWLFSVVWAVLYALMGISAYLIYFSDSSADKKLALWLYAAQLAVNFSWSIVFFKYEKLWAGAAVIILLILIFNQPTDKSSAEISPFFVKLPCRAASPPAVTFLDWAYFICRLCL